MSSSNIRILLKSFDYKILDKSARTIISIARVTGAVIIGPIPLPSKKQLYTINRSPHIDKESREQFKLCEYKRLIDIISWSHQTVDALMKLDLAMGVEVNIKI